MVSGSPTSWDLETEYAMVLELQLATLADPGWTRHAAPLVCLLL